MKKIWIITVIVIIAVLTISITITNIKKEPEKIKIGASLPLTGEVASYGIRAKRGIEIGLQEVNLAGGIKGKKLNVIFEDDRNDPKTGVAIIKKFATVDKVPAVIGSAGSTVALAMAPVANQYKVVLLSPISSSVKLTTEGGPFFFRVCPADDAQAKILAQWVLEEGYRKAAVIFTNNSWGKPLADAFQKYFREGGGEVVLLEGVEEKTTDLRTQLAKISSRGVDVVISPTYPVEGGSLLRQAKEMGLKAKFYGGDNWDAPEFLTIAGDAAEGVFFVDPSETKGSKYSEFAEKYKKKYGEEPDINAAFGYDALISLAEAMKLAETLNGDSIRKALYKVSFDGASGKIEFDENGDLKAPAFDRNMIRSGKKVKIEE